jgi:hypothetical protein
MILLSGMFWQVRAPGFLQPLPPMPLTYGNTACATF